MAPYRSDLMDVRPEWIDYNGHLNLAYYHVLFDRGIDGFLDSIGLGEAYRAARRMTTYTVEAHVCYLREVPPGSMVRVHSHLVEHDAKRIHVFQEMYHGDGWLAATLESMSLSIDQGDADRPKAAPFPPDIAETLDRLARDQRVDALPERIGRRIRMSAGSS